MGLIGELILLNKLIDTSVHNINYWVADTQSIDFSIQNNLIEVKTTLKDKHSHIINGLDQLKIIEGKNKYILSILVKKSDLKTSDTLNLLDYIEQIENKIAEDPEIQDIFYLKLKKVGYNEINRTKYTDYNFIVIDKLFYNVNENWVAEDRRKLLAFARDLLNSDYAGHRLTFQLFAQSPPFAHLNAVYNNFDFSGPLDFVRNAAGLSEKVMQK